jgi:hypothetical protein
MDLLLFNELYGKIVFVVEEMWQTFEHADTAKSLLDHAQKLGLHTGSRWRDWPADTSEAKVLKWFFGLLEKLQPHWPRSVGPYSYEFAQSGSLPLKDGDCIRETDIVVVTRSIINDNDPEERKTPRRISWHNVRVIGELKSNSDKSDLDLTILQLANYARELFGVQPNRRWIHGFILCGCHLRVWRFDRAGACGSTLINIHTEPTLFLRAIISYLTMDATQIGFDPSIRWSPREGTEEVFDPTVHFVTDHPPYPFIYVPVSFEDTATAAATTNAVSFEDTATAAATTNAVSSEDTATAAATTNAVSFEDTATAAATTNATPSKVHLLKILRPPLSIAASPCMSWTALSIDPASLSSRTAVVSRGSVCWQARLRDAPRGSPWTYVVKDQWRAEQREPEGSFLCSISESHPSLPRYWWHGDIVHLSLSPEAEDIRFIRRQFPTMAAEVGAPKHVRKISDGSKHLYSVGCSLDNRVHTRLVTGPVGLSLLRFTTYTQLLCGLRDAIQGNSPFSTPNMLDGYYREPVLIELYAGHRHMFDNYNILHRDISGNNILLRGSGDSGGFLIDFDLAIRNDRTESSGTAHRTGTLEFMALDVMHPPAGHWHTPLHDLESFFYVLLWICINYEKGGKPRRPPPEQMVFRKPAASDENPFLTAYLFKRGAMTAKSFKKYTLPTVGDEARKLLESTLLKWWAATFPPDDDTDDEDATKLAAKIAQRYDTVLRILDEGIQELDGA